MDRLAARRWWLVAAIAVLGLVVGLIVAFTTSTTRRAEAAILVSSPRGVGAVTPELPNLQTLATSSVLAGNVRSTLRLTQSEETIRARLHASIRPHSQVIVLSATAADADHARQLAQEAATVFTQLVSVRFGSTSPPLHAAILDAAHALSTPERHVLRDSLLGLGVGLLVGALAALALANRTTAVAAPADLRKREALLDRRVEAVTVRELELAQRAARLVLREEELESRAGPKPTAELEPEAESVPEPEPEPELAAELEPEPEPEPEPVPVPASAEPVSAVELVPEPARLATVGPPWTLVELERLVDEAAPAASPETVEEWRAYLFHLREHASVDGTLPSAFDPLVTEVFGPLLD